MNHLHQLRENLRREIESSALGKQFGSGWISGTAALVGSAAGFLLVICVRYPGIFTVPMLHPYYERIEFRLIIQAVLFLSFLLAVISLLLRPSKVLPLTAITLILCASVLGSLPPSTHPDLIANTYLGLDWFILNLFLTGTLFIPIERFYPRRSEQGLFRTEWREDLFYYFVSSLLVQIFTFLSLWPSQFLAAHTQWEEIRTFVGRQAFILQLLAIMFLTDLVQYWVHRAFHRIPWLWNFHAVHHSAKAMDWMAGARMHFFEIVALRGLTVFPMQLLGFQTSAIQTYILIVYLYSTLIHANINWSPAWLSRILVTPQFHHWHHGIEKEAIDVNFAIHFPIFDKLFGTYHMPGDRWPSGYGIATHPVPNGYWRQFLYPFRRR